MLLRGDTHHQQADVNIYLRRLGPATRYRLTINARGCGNSSPASHKIFGAKFTSDAQGEVFKTVSDAFVSNKYVSLGRYTLSIWERWSGPERRACQTTRTGAHVDNGPDAMWQGYLSTGQVRGLYAGFDIGGTVKDAIYLDLPAAGTQYRLTLNAHDCAMNEPDQDLMHQSTFTSDQYAEYFQPFKVLPNDEVIDRVFSLSVYTGWTGMNRIRCRNLTYFSQVLMR